jgi:hypothetical protein
MTLYFVPCGISVLNALRKPTAPYPRTDARTRFLKAELHWRAGARNHTDEQLLADWAQHVGEEAEDARVAEADAACFCAETQTLVQRTGKPLPQLLRDGDRIVLIASDTGDGISAAMCVAYIMAGGDLGDIRYLTAPGADQVSGFPDRLGKGKVTVVRVPGLGPHTSEVRAAVAAIGRILRSLFLLVEALEVHLTGGYKLTLLHTMAMTEIVYSMAPDRTSAWYVYEGADAQAVQIGLRRFSEDLLRDMREELGNAATGKGPGGPATFEGQLWKRLGEDSQLTDFGEGFLAVLSGPPITRS